MFAVIAAHTNNLGRRSRKKQPCRRHRLGSTLLRLRKIRNHAIRRGLSNLSGTGHIFNQPKARAVWGDKAAISHSERLQKKCKGFLATSMNESTQNRMYRKSLFYR